MTLAPAWGPGAGPAYLGSTFAKTPARRFAAGGRHTMTKRLHCVLTTRDYAMMEDFLDSGAYVGEGVAALARRKLAGAMIVFPDDVPPDVATVNSRIAFTVGDRPAETRVLVRDAGHRVSGAALRVDTLRGMALLGLEADEHVVLERPDGSSETL
ncbi:MAG TPA: hypothetical protein VLT58_16485, partial [Polyangia bacterium]|nr:hypothetical protein [Polyangia bacterium]